VWISSYTFRHAISDDGDRDVSDDEIFLKSLFLPVRSLAYVPRSPYHVFAYVLYCKFENLGALRSERIGEAQ